MLAILLCLNVIVKSLPFAESFEKSRYQVRNEVPLQKRDEEDDLRLKKLLEIYDKAEFGEIVPHSKCALKSEPYCIKNEHFVGKLFCEAIASATTKLKQCVIKGRDVADPKIWKPHKLCYKLFKYPTDDETDLEQTGMQFLFKGCSFITREKDPICSAKSVFTEPAKFTCTKIIAVNGSWAEWEAWSECSKSCGSGRTRHRNRTCTNPPPKGTGEPCPDVASQTAPCLSQKFIPCPMDGRWSKWSDWVGCSKTCGLDRFKKRNRTCTNPAPRDGGKPCPGSAVENGGSCDKIPCPNYLQFESNKCLIWNQMCSTANDDYNVKMEGHLDCCAGLICQERGDDVMKYCVSISEAEMNY